MWETFRRLAPSLSDRAPGIDSAWLAARGIQSESPLALQTIRDDVGALVRELGDRLEWFAFLVHDYGTGVPTTSEDHSIYLHVRLALVADEELVLGSPWLLTRRTSLSHEMAGVDVGAFQDGIDAAWRLLGEQSAWLLSLLEQQRPDVDPLQRLLHVRQFLHFFANMAQMKIA